MAHYAELDDNNVVVRVVVMSDDLQDGEKECAHLYGGRWKQTSYNGNFRARYASPGMLYNTQHDAFVYPQPYPSWTLDQACEWIAPIPKPEGKHRWVESLLRWIPICTPTTSLTIEDEPLPQSFVQRYGLVESTIVPIRSDSVFALGLEMTNNRIFCHGVVHEWQAETRARVLAEISRALDQVQNDCQRDVYAYSTYGDEENNPLSGKTLHFSELVGFSDSMKAVLADGLEHTITIRRYVQR